MSYPNYEPSIHLVGNEKIMSTQFPNYKVATAETDDLNGKKRISFEYKGLDYIFNFDPDIDDTPGGATLSYVGDNERGRLSPREYAADEAWPIALLAMGLD